MISQDLYHYFLLEFIWSSYLIFVEVACNQTCSVCSVSRGGKTMLDKTFWCILFYFTSAHFRAAHCWTHFWVARGTGPSKEGERLAEEVAVWLHLVVTLLECCGSKPGSLPPLLHSLPPPRCAGSRGRCTQMKGVDFTQSCDLICDAPSDLQTWSSCFLGNWLPPLLGCACLTSLPERTSALSPHQRPFF